MTIYVVSKVYCTLHIEAMRPPLVAFLEQLTTRKLAMQLSDRVPELHLRSDERTQNEEL